MKRYIAYVLLAAPCVLACGPTAPGGSGGAGGTGATGGTGGSTGDGIPCNVAHATSTCAGCHNGLITRPKLQTLADFQANHVAAAGAVQSGAMPRGGGITTQERTDLVNWLNSGAPAGSCP